VGGVEGATEQADADAAASAEAGDGVGIRGTEA